MAKSKNKLINIVLSGILSIVILVALCPISLVTAVPNSNAENVAPNATMIEAETPGWVPDWMKWPMLIDGKKNDGCYTSEYMDNQNTEKQLVFVFGDYYKFSQIILYPRVQDHHNGFPQEFKIEVSSDAGETWVQVATGTAAQDENGHVADPVTVNLEATTGNRVRITATKLGNADNATQYALQLAEVEIMGETAEAPTPDSSVNIAPNATTIDAETPGWVPDWMKWPMLIDGKKNDGCYTSEYMDNQNTEKQLVFVFGDYYKFSQIILYPRVQDHHNGFPQEFKIEVSSDAGETWVQVATGTAAQDENGHVADPVTVNLEATTGNRVRITATKLGNADNATQYALQLAEVEIMGETAEAPTPDSSVNIAPNATTIKAETPVWVLDWMKWPMLIDGNKADGFYTSEFETSADVTKIIQFDFEKTYKIDRVVLYPAKDKGSLVGFPVDFTVSVWNGTSWVVVATEQNASASGAFEIEFDAIEANAVCVKATKLGRESGGKYALMLAEMEIYGTETATQLNPAEDMEAPGTDKPGTGVPGTDEPGATENVAPVGAIEAETPVWAVDWMKWPMLIDGNTNDGFYTSEFETSADVTKIIQFDFEKTYKIDRVVLYPAKDKGSLVGFPVDFTVSVWNGTSWVVVATEQNASASGAFEIEFDAIEANAVCVKATKLGQESGGKYALMLAEMEIYGAETNKTLPAAPAAGVDDNAGAGSNKPLFDSSLNVAQGCPVDVSSDYRQYSCNRENLTDGNENTFWATNAQEYKPGKDEWAEINLLQNYKINKIILLARPDGWGFPIDFTISIFYDGEWTEVLDVKDYQIIENAGRVTAYEFDIPETIGNKIRLTSNRYRDAGVDKVICLNEIVVYGTKYENGILPNDNLVAINSQVTTSSSVEDYAYYRQNLSDGNYQSEWSSVTTSHENEEVWIQVDLFCEFLVSEIQLKPAWGGHGFPVNFSIQVCENGEWVTVYTAENYEKPVDEAIQRFQFEQRNITAFKIVVNKMERFCGLYSVKLAEVMAYHVPVGDDFDPDALQGESATQTNFPNSSKDVLYDDKGNVIDAEGNVLIPANLLPANLLKGGSGWTVAILIVGIVLVLVSAGGIFWICRKKKNKQKAGC